MSVPNINARAGEEYTFGVDYGAYLAKGDTVTSAVSFVEDSVTPGGGPSLTITELAVSAGHNGLTVKVAVNAAAVTGAVYSCTAKAGTALGSPQTIPVTLTIVA